MNMYLIGLVATIAMFVVWAAFDFVLRRVYIDSEGDQAWSRGGLSVFFLLAWFFLFAWVGETDQAQKKQIEQCKWQTTTANGVTIVQCVYPQ